MGHIFSKHPVKLQTRNRDTSHHFTSLYTINTGNQDKATQWLCPVATAKHKQQLTPYYTLHTNSNHHTIHHSCIARIITRYPPQPSDLIYTAYKAIMKLQPVPRLPAWASTVTTPGRRSWWSTERSAYKMAEEAQGFQGQGPQDTPVL